MRGTTNRNARGSSADRRARRRWLLTSWAADVSGFCRCYRCGQLLSDETITMDRSFARLMAKIDSTPAAENTELANRPPEEWELQRVLP